jgi:adenylate cyclase
VKLRAYLLRLPWVAAIGALVGAAVGAAAIEPRLTGAGMGALSGMIDFLALALLIGGAETFLPQTRLGRILERSPFLAVFALKSLLYGVIIVAVIGGRLGPFLIAAVIGPERAQPIHAQVVANMPLGLLVPLAFLVTALFILLHQLGQLVGDRALRDIVLGRYHRARAEDRFFLFADIVGSTRLAERLGPQAVSRFLDRVFQIASDPIDEHGGEVYQYVGDEMVITWTAAEGGRGGRALACYFAIERALAGAAHEFLRQFGVAPKLRGALHAGTVITGEVGGSRRAIVFHGDVMNTASRLENATRELERPFLVSEDALQRLDGASGYRMDDLGLQRVRGREAPIRVYSVT